MKQGKTARRRISLKNGAFYAREKEQAVPLSRRKLRPREMVKRYPHAKPPQSVMPWSSSGKSVETRESSEEDTADIM
jgi:hypothetical protein